MAESKVFEITKLHKVEVWAERVFCGRGIDLYLEAEVEGIKGPVNITAIHGHTIDPSEGVFPQRGPISLRNKEAQSLMDQLWSCGLRPSEGSGSAGALAATERHLTDLQKLCFETLLPRLMTPTCDVQKQGDGDG